MNIRFIQANLKTVYPTFLQKQAHFLLFMHYTSDIFFLNDLVVTKFYVRNIDTILQNICFQVLCTCSEGSQVLVDYFQDSFTDFMSEKTEKFFKQTLQHEKLSRSSKNKNKRSFVDDNELASFLDHLRDKPGDVIDDSDYDSLESDQSGFSDENDGKYRPVIVSTTKCDYPSATYSPASVHKDLKIHQRSSKSTDDLKPQGNKNSGLPDRSNYRDGKFEVRQVNSGSVYNQNPDSANRSKSDNKEVGSYERTTIPTLSSFAARIQNSSLGSTSNSEDENSKYHQMTPRDQNQIGHQKKDAKSDISNKPVALKGVDLHSDATNDSPGNLREKNKPPSINQITDSPSLLELGEKHPSSSKTSVNPNHRLFGRRRVLKNRIRELIQSYRSNAPKIDNNLKPDSIPNKYAINPDVYLRYKLDLENFFELETRCVRCDNKKMLRILKKISALLTEHNKEFMHFFIIYLPEITAMIKDLNPDCCRFEEMSNFYLDILNTYKKHTGHLDRPFIRKVIRCSFYKSYKKYLCEVLLKAESTMQFFRKTRSFINKILHVVQKDRCYQLIDVIHCLLETRPDLFYTDETGNGLFFEELVNNGHILFDIMYKATDILEVDKIVKLIERILPHVSDFTKEQNCVRIFMKGFRAYFYDIYDHKLTGKSVYEPNVDSRLSAPGIPLKSTLLGTGLDKLSGNGVYEPNMDSRLSAPRIPSKSTLVDTGLRSVDDVLDRNGEILAASRSETKNCHGVNESKQPLNLMTANKQHTLAHKSDVRELFDSISGLSELYFEISTASTHNKHEESENSKNLENTGNLGISDHKISMDSSIFTNQDTEIRCSNGNIQEVRRFLNILGESVNLGFSQESVDFLSQIRTGCWKNQIRDFLEFWIRVCQDPSSDVINHSGRDSRVKEHILDPDFITKFAVFLLISFSHPKNLLPADSQINVKLFDELKAIFNVSARSLEEYISEAANHKYFHNRTIEETMRDDTAQKHNGESNIILRTHNCLDHSKNITKGFLDPERAPDDLKSGIPDERDTNPEDRVNNHPQLRETTPPIQVIEKPVLNPEIAGCTHVSEHLDDNATKKSVQSFPADPRIDEFLKDFIVNSKCTKWRDDLTYMDLKNVINDPILDYKRYKILHILSMFLECNRDLILQLHSRFDCFFPLLNYLFSYKHDTYIHNHVLKISQIILSVPVRAVNFIRKYIETIFSGLIYVGKQQNISNFSPKPEITSRFAHCVSLYTMIGKFKDEIVGLKGLKASEKTVLEVIDELNDNHEFAEVENVYVEDQKRSLMAPNEDVRGFFDAKVNDSHVRYALYQMLENWKVFGL